MDSPQPRDTRGIETLAQMANLRIEPDRLEAVAIALEQMMAFASELDQFDIGLAEPAPVFDPGWLATREEEA